MMRYSRRQVYKELDDVKNNVDDVGERLYKYEENLQRLDRCVQRLEKLVSRWDQDTPSRSASGIDGIMSIANALQSGNGDNSFLGIIGRLSDVLKPVMGVAKVVQGASRGDVKLDLSRVSKDGVASVLLLGLMVHSMQDKLREGIESIIEVAKPYQGVARSLLSLSDTVSNPNTLQAMMSAIGGLGQGDVQSTSQAQATEEPSRVADINGARRNRRTGDIISIAGKFLKKPYTYD